MLRAICLPGSISRKERSGLRLISPSLNRRSSDFFAIAWLKSSAASENETPSSAHRRWNPER